MRSLIIRFLRVGLQTAHPCQTLFILLGLFFPTLASAIMPQVAAGDRHSIGLGADGKVYGWGDDTYGQLGLGRVLMAAAPQAVPGLNLGLGTVKSRIAVGFSHNVVVRSDGSVWAWGGNSYGQLGDGTKTSRSSPVQVPGLTGVVAVAAGPNHSLAVKSDGSVWAWGENSSGQLGDGIAIDRTSPGQVPGQVPGLTGVVAVAAGYAHSLALKSDGSVWAWGSNTIGQLGDGTILPIRTSPGQVPGLTGVVAVAAGYAHSIALKSDGSIWAWGFNYYGQLGDGTKTDRSSPVQVAGLSGVVAVAAGRYYSLAVKSDGSVWAWGDNNSAALHVSSPVQVRGLYGVVVSLAAGQYHSLAVKSDGSVWAWGDNSYGELGDGTTTNRYSSVQVPVFADVAAVAAGQNHSLAVKSDGSVWAWGDNTYGELGDGTTMNRSSPVQVPGFAGVVTVAAEAHHTLAVKSDGSVWAWGDNSYGELGDGTTMNRSSPVQVSNLSGVVAVAAGYAHTLAVKSDGSVWAWGSNTMDQLGDGTMFHIQPSPPGQVGQVSGLTGVVAVAAGYAHSLALKSDGSVWAWGANSSGQLGDGSMIANSRSLPVRVPGLAGVVAVAAGYVHSLALKSDGSVWAWGGNSYGELGDGTTTNRFSPVQVPGLTGVAVVAGYLAIKPDGSVWAWGANYDGRIGDGTTMNRFSPVQVPGLTGVAAVAGSNHSLAVKSDGSVWAWGANDNGQLGDGTTMGRLSPVVVANLNLVVTPQVIEFYNASLDHYFITADSSEAAAIDNGSAGPGWSRTGNTFKSGGSTTVCRFYGSLSPGPNSHFYTADPGECAYLKQLQASTPATQKRWNFESLDFVSTPTTNGTCPTGTAPAYRAYNNGFGRGIDSNHRIASNLAAIQEVVTRGWSNEGVVMCAPN